VIVELTALLEHLRAMFRDRLGRLSAIVDLCSLGPRVAGLGSLNGHHRLNPLEQSSIEPRSSGVASTG
jgi:hypothetical protein